MSSELLKRQALTLLLVALSSEVHATTWLREVLQLDTGHTSQQVEVVLGAPLTLTSDFAPRSPTEFVANATSSSTSSTGQEFAELYFEDEQGLERVIVDGSARRGFTVTLEFHRPVKLETIPQHSRNRFSVIYTGQKTYRKLIRGTGKAASDQAPVAISFEVSGRLPVSAVTPEIAANRVVYRNPNQRTQIRVGFYPTETAATVALRELRGAHPDVALTRVTAAEVEYAKVFNLYPEQLLAQYDVRPREPAAETPAPEPLVVTVQPVTPSTISETEPALSEVQAEWTDTLDLSLLDEAQEAYTDGDYGRAITLYTKAESDPQLRETAIEMLGVSRERNGQLAHAKAQYERFLAEYPDSAAAPRVSQRLSSLIGSNASRPQLRMPEQAEDTAYWSLVGNVSQFYQRYSLDINDSDSVPIDGLFSDANLIARRQSSSASHEARLSAGHVWDFSDDEDSTSRIHRLTWESFFERPGLGFKIGRQSRNDAGILGRFDGITLSWRMNDALRWNVIGGYVARSNYDNPTTDRPVYGINAELELLDGDLSFTPFFVEHERDGIVDRRAVGMHSLLFTPRATFSSLVDYDTYHQVLNNFIVNASVNVSEDWRVSGTYDFRRSPYLTTSNALIGQRYDDLSELEQTLVDLKLDDVAADRTAKAHLSRLGLFGALNDTWSVSLDTSISHFSDTSDSLGVAGLDDRTDYHVTAQLRADDLFAENTFTSVQARYMGSDTSETTTLYFTNRFATRDFHVFPKFVISERTYKATDQDQLRMLPSLRIDYRGINRLRLEMEVGYEWTNQETLADDTDIRGMFFRFGYRTLF